MTRSIPAPALAIVVCACLTVRGEETPAAYSADRGTWRHHIQSPYLSGTNLVEVLLPDAHANDDTTRFRVLYVLPVEAGEQRRWGDGLKVIRTLGLHNRHRLICVAPTFDTTPWYGNHATDPKTRHEDHLMKVVLPLVESHYRTAEGPDGRLLLGFSKSGWGAVSMLLRHGDVFGAAASWDAPLMFTEKQCGIWETGRHFGSPATMSKYLPTALLQQHAGEFQDKPRLVITGKASFGTNGDPRFPYDGPCHTEAFHELADALGVKHAYRADIKATHSWNKEWIEPVVTMLMGLVTDGHEQEEPQVHGHGKEHDVVIYGGTSGAVVAAVRAAMLGASVVVVSPDKHLGGLSSGGLGYTDSGNTRAIGSLAREFYRRVWKHYESPEAWAWQPRESFASLGQGVKKSDVGDNSMWLFEPHVAEGIFDRWLTEHGVEVVRDALIDREKGVEMGPLGESKASRRIVAITTLASPAGPAQRFAGKVFIDATYEGDLMATAGVTYHVGREANAVYGEEWNGNQVGILHHGHHWKMPVDPFKQPGNPASGLLPLVSADPPGTRGEGDARVQAYCFRMCLTDHPDNRVPFAKPAGYDPGTYELLARTLAAGWREVFNKFDAVPNRKTDTNNHGPFSFDHIGANYDYPEASYERRRAIIEDHVRYQQGLLWFLAHDDRVPADIRTKMQTWGLPKDEYADNGHWSPQLYIREARRMLGEDVLTEHECLGHRDVKEPIGMGSYTLDSHNVRRYVTPEGTVQNEGDIGVHPKQPYQIGYGSLVPKRTECANLLVPICLSASHIAYGSARMEPVFMLLGDAAANAAVLAARAGSAVQDVDYASLRGLLESQGQVLALPK